MNVDKVLAKIFPDIRTNYTKKDTMLYGLGVGACNDPLDLGQLRFVFERELQALPSMSCVLAHPGFWISAPELEVNWIKLVHAEQSFELNMALPVEGEVIGRYQITRIKDKGAEKGALMDIKKSLYTVDEQFIGSVVSTYFLRGDGGCGDWGDEGDDLAQVPTTPADGYIDMPSSDISALIYRLSGDYNPLHADPEVAVKAGFEKPILHGLCTYGIACQSLVKALCDGDVARFRGMAARFTKPVYPGETIKTEYWSAGEEVRFRCISIERDLVVLDRGMARIIA